MTVTVVDTDEASAKIYEEYWKLYVDYGVEAASLWLYNQGKHVSRDKLAEAGRKHGFM
tara:strand:+ start:449 stop:622 length:174 start_codon:yes stop_codon:yes gene_type:complete